MPEAVADGLREQDVPRVRRLMCLLSVERRENKALRKHNDWLARRVELLELRLWSAERQAGKAPATEELVG